MYYRKQILSFFSSDFFNVHSSFNIKNKLLTFSVVILYMTMEEIVSQIFYSGPRFCFMWLRK